MAWTWYGCRRIAGGYRIVNFDEDLNVMRIYHVLGNIGNHMNCNCPQGSRTNMCKHPTIVLLFEQHNRVDQGFFLDYENMKWHLPLTYRKLRERG